MASQPDPLLPVHSRICLLVCDPTNSKFVDAYGDITNLFTGLYTKLLLRLAGGGPSLLPDVMKSFRILPFKVYEETFPDLDTIDQFDSVIVSGSGHSVNDDQPWILKLGDLLHKIATQRPKVKLIGVCFGHQIISHAVFGLPVKRNPEGWEIGPYKVDLNETGKKLFRGKDHLNIQMIHQDAVFTSSQLAYFDNLVKAAPYGIILPQNEYKVWGSTPKTPNQGIIALNKDVPKDRLNVDNIHVFTIQGHPEKTSGMVSLLIDIFEDDVGKEVSEEGRKRIAEFKGTLDWFLLSLLMWAISTKHSVSLPQLSDYADKYLSLLHGLKAPQGLTGAALTSDESVFVYVT